MGDGDHLPSGGHTRKMNPAQIKKMIESMKKSKEIAQKSAEEHQKTDAPAADAQLNADLDQLFKS